MEEELGIQKNLEVQHADTSRSVQSTNRARVHRPLIVVSRRHPRDAKVTDLKPLSRTALLITESEECSFPNVSYNEQQLQHQAQRACLQPLEELLLR